MAGNLWSCDYDANKIYQHTGGTSTITTSFASPGNSPMGLTWDGTNLWSCDYAGNLWSHGSNTNKIYQHTGGTSTITTSFAGPGGAPYGLTWEAVAATSIKTVFGIPIANIGKINGVAIADVKSWLGISNVD